MQARGKAAQEIQQAEEQKRAREIAEEIAQARLKHNRIPTEQQNQTASSQSNQQVPVNNHLQYSHPRPQPQPPVAQPQPQPLMPQSPVQQQQPLQHMAYPPGYPSPYGQHPDPGYHYPPQQPAYGYPYPPVPQFQPPYGQYPHGYQQPYLPYNQPNPDDVYQQAQHQPTFVLHMPPEEQYVAQPSGFVSWALPPGHSQVHPEYAVRSNTNIVEFGAINNAASSNHPEENLEPMVTQFNEFKLSDTATEIAVREQSLDTAQQEKQWPDLYIKLEGIDGLNEARAYLREIAANQEAAEAAIHISITILVARTAILDLFTVKSTLPLKHSLTAAKIQKTLTRANHELCNLIRNIDTIDEIKNFINLDKLMCKAATLYQKFNQLGPGKKSVFHVMLELVQEMRIRLYAEWEQFKVSKKNYLPQLKVK
jgi:hypothetical protein